MPVASSTTRQQLRVLLKRFKFTELESAVLPIFPETSWNHIRSKLVAHHGTFTVANAVELIEDAVIDVTEKDLQNRLSQLELIDISRHHNKKIWYTYSMKDSQDNTYLTNSEIENRIKNQFILLGMEMNVKATTHDGITFVLIKEKKASSKKERTSAIFFALFLGQKYFFCSRKNVPKNFLVAVLNSMEGKSFKSLKLAGRDLKSLIRLLWMKRQGAANAASVTRLAEYKQPQPTVRKSGVNFTAYKKREEYIRKCFGDDPPILESLVVNGPEQPWNDEIVSMELSTERIYTGWEFRSRDIARFLTKLAERRVLVTPLPYYISHVMTMGRNEIVLKSSSP